LRPFTPPGFGKNCFTFSYEDNLKGMGADHASYNEGNCRQKIGYQQNLLHKLKMSKYAPSQSIKSLLLSHFSSIIPSLWLERGWEKITPKSHECLKELIKILNWKQKMMPMSTRSMKWKRKR